MLRMTELATAGGPIEIAGPGKQPDIVGEDQPWKVRYKAPTLNEASRYSVSVVKRRLSAVFTRGDEGWIARCPELGSLGYGESVTEAFEDLHRAAQDYLEVIKDKALSPENEQHGVYTALLRVSQDSWFAFISR